MFTNTIDNRANARYGAFTQGKEGGGHFFEGGLFSGIRPRMSKSKMSNARMSNISVQVPRMSKCAN